jgi:NAD-dependent SIR2 family protein deacetylase
VHVNRGVSCVSCHGQVNEMPLMWKTESLRMQWCLDCHRDPAPHLRPREEVFNMAWHPDNDPEKYKGRSTIEIGRDLMEKYKINTYQLTNCSICHY